MGNQVKEQVALLTDYENGSAYSEAYHTIYTNIRINWKNDQIKQHTLLLASPVAHAEQAAVVANIAIAAAQSGTPTILVDADLRNPGLQQRFGIGQSSGLGELLEEETITPETVTKYLSKTFIPNLFLLSAGTALIPGATSLLSMKLQEVITNLCLYLAKSESQSSVIIFHSPAVLASADTLLIGAEVDEAILTITTGHTTRTQAKQAQEQLQRAHVKLSGVIMLDK